MLAFITETFEVASEIFDDAEFALHFFNEAMHLLHLLH